MSRGTPALIAWLTTATLVLILVFSVARRFGSARGRRQGLLDRAVLEPAARPGPRHRRRRRRHLAVPADHAALTIGGLFIVSALIGVIAAGIDAKLADLRRGRSLVIEKDHT